MLINGEWVDSPVHTEVTDPDTREAVGSVPVAQPADVDAAVEGAFAAQRGCKLSGDERATILSKAATRLEQRLEDAAVTIATEGVKTIREARAEARRAVATLRLSAEEAKRAVGETLILDQFPSGAERFGFTVREPLGVIAAITPYNDPLNLVAHKVGPALAAGNAVVVKPDVRTPFSALFIAEMLQQAGLPAGMLQVVTGPGATTGGALVEHPKVAMVSFTGGLQTGRRIASTVGMKRITMELGANNAVIVHKDADIDLAVERIVSGAFWAAGQNCLHVQRAIIHESIFEDLTERLVEGAEKLIVGRKLDESADMGPMIDQAALDRVKRWIAEEIDQGARLLTGGPGETNSLRPTLLTNVAPNGRLALEEVYGPVTALMSFQSLNEAIRVANSTAYGLAAAIFTQQLDTAFLAASQLRSGQVMINESTDFRVDSMPFGGNGASGQGREGVRHALLSMTDPKVVALSGVAVPGLG